MMKVPDQISVDCLRECIDTYVAAIRKADEMEKWLTVLHSKPVRCLDISTNPILRIRPAEAKDSVRSSSPNGLCDAIGKVILGNPAVLSSAIAIVYTNAQKARIELVAEAQRILDEEKVN